MDNLEKLYDSDDNYSFKDKRKSFYHEPLFRQMCLVLPPASCIFSTGIVMGTMTVLMPQLKQQKDFDMTDEMVSWLYSAHGIAALPSLIALPILADRYGRRPIYLLSCLALTISWVIEYYAESFTAYLAAELFQSIIMASNGVVGILYISECSDPKYRGIFLVFKSASYVWGICIANIIGTFTDSKYSCVLGFMTGLFSLIGLFMLPESPVWLADKNRYKESKKSFFWFRDNVAEDTMIEFKQMISHYSNKFPKHTKKSMSMSEHLFEIFSVACSREFILPFLISIVCFGMYQFCGKTVISVYALVIIKEITNDISLAYIFMLIIDAISVLGMYMGCYLVFKVKRRVMLFSTSLAGVFFMCLMSVLLFMFEYNIFRSNSSVMLVLLVLYSFAVSLGPMCVTTSLYAEIVPHKFKTVTSGFAMLTFFALQTLFLKCNPYLMNTIGLKGVFLLYASFSSLVLLFLYFFLPETKDKTLSEIENCFSKKMDVYANDLKSIIS